MTTKKYWRKEPLDDVITIAAPEILRDAVYLLIDNKIITKNSLLIESGLSTCDLTKICALPDNFFTNCNYNQRKKPILKLVQ